MTRYKCYTCGKTFSSPEEKESHQYTQYHGKYRNDEDNEPGGMGRNEIGGM